MSLRQVLHPVRSVRSLYRKAVRRALRYLAGRQFRSIRRGQRDACWCGGSLLPFKWHESYGVCAECGCYVNRRPPLQEELTRIYAFDLYWHTRQRVKNHPTIEDRSANDLSDGRVDYWIDLIARCGPAEGRVVEVGCAHGVLLVELRARGYECVGVEPDERTAAWTARQTGLDIRSGFFPDVEVPECDLFLALDVIEHSLEPARFMKGAARCLKPDGIVVIQTPIGEDGNERPFDGMFDKVFDDLEHLHVFVERSLRLLAERSGLSVIGRESWRLAHEVTVLKKGSD